MSVAFNVHCNLQMRRLRWGRWSDRLHSLKFVGVRGRRRHRLFAPPPRHMIHGRYKNKQDGPNTGPHSVAYKVCMWWRMKIICIYLYVGKTLAPSVSGLNLVVVAVLRDSLCVMSLLPCMADCCKLYTVCKVERFVITSIKWRLLLLLLFIKMFSSSSRVRSAV